MNCKFYECTFFLLLFICFFVENDAQKHMSRDTYTYGLLIHFFLFYVFNVMLPACLPNFTEVACLTKEVEQACPKCLNQEE